MFILKEQYNYIKSARQVVFEHLSTVPEHQLLAPVAAFNNKSIRWMAIHICNVYIHWTGNYALDKKMPYLNENDASDISDLRSAFTTADALMETFFETFDNRLTDEITNPINGKIITATPLQVFTHVATHEFHHKGQMMSMSRLLGNVPPDTDVIRT